MKRRALVLPPLLCILWACSPAAPPKPPAAAVIAPAPSPTPAKSMKMVCRSSQTGQAVECGTPGAVMVGMKEE
jgi:hypothetical protein